MIPKTAFAALTALMLSAWAFGIVCDDCSLHGCKGIQTVQRTTQRTTQRQTMTGGRMIQNRQTGVIHADGRRCRHGMKKRIVQPVMVMTDGRKKQNEHQRLT